MGDPSNRWLVEALRVFAEACKANGCKAVNADIVIDGLKYSDIVDFEGAQFHIHKGGKNG